MARLLFVRIPFAICGVLVLAAVAINIANVVGRYVFDAPVSWAEEVMSYIIIWGVFIAVAAMTYQGNHLRMDLLVRHARGRSRARLGALTVVLIVFCSLFVMIQSFQIVQLYAATWETSMGARIPLVYAHAALLVGFFLMALAAIVRARNYLTGTIRLNAASGACAGRERQAWGIGMGWVMSLLPLVLLLLGIPIFVLLLTTCITAIVFFSKLPHTVVHQLLFDALNKFPLIAVPFFIFTGDLMSRGGLSARLMRWVASMFGSFRASLPLTSLGFAAVFGAISGATTASVAAVGSITYPRLREAGYSERFASALIVSECALDNLIPPSIAFILYGIATETSVAHLFAAGIIPGLVLGGVFAVYIYVHSFKENIDVRQKFSWSEFLAASREGLWPLGAIVVIFGGIYSGVFSPTEAAGVSCVYAIFVAMVIYREVDLEGLFQSAARTLFLTGTFFLIVSVAGHVRLAADHQRRGRHGVERHHDHAGAGLDRPADDQRVPAGRRLLPRHRHGAAGAVAAAAADRQADRRRSDPFRRHRGDESHHRRLPPAVRAQHFRVPGAVQDAVERAVSRTDPVRRAGDPGADAGDLHPGAVAVPAALHAALRRRAGPPQLPAPRPMA